VTAVLAVDGGLALLALAIAAYSLRARANYTAVLAFIAFGLVLSLVWVRIAAVDVALTEAAIGGGLTGVLMLGAAARLRSTEAAGLQSPGRAIRVIGALLAAAVSGALMVAVLALPEPAPTLAHEARSNLGATGVGNPVTAVLMVFRGTDTFLEKVVLLLALVGVWSLAADDKWGGRPGLRHEADPKGMLAFFARLLPPIGFVIGVYLLWVSADHPGGAFQGATVLAAMWLLTMMARLTDAPPIGGRRLRLALIAGPSMFLLVGLGGLWFGDGFLAFPPGHEKAVIVAIEVLMLLTVAVTLGLLMAGAPERIERDPAARSEGRE
jgi:multisubunit Na+/H+ antiporter MnhB subunit